MPIIIDPKQPQSLSQGEPLAPSKAVTKIVQFPTRDKRNKTITAIVYCEGNFGAPDGKTANGLVRHSEKYKIISVIDSKQVGLDSGLVLDDTPNAIPICRDLDDALARAGHTPDYFIFGMAVW